MAKFETKKSLGQHFLTSDVVPRWMCDAGEVQKGDMVLEIGPGTGVLTKEILARGAHVVAIEADLRAIETLEVTFQKEIADGTLRVTQGDMRKLGAEDIAKTFGLRDHKYKIIANIPYYLSGHLFRTFLESTFQPSTLVFLVQKEVAARIACRRPGSGRQARDEKESILSLSVKAYGTPTYVRTVSKGHFAPPPKIDSAIVAVTNINRENFSELETQRFFELLHLGFGEKRKQLLGNLAKQYEREQLVHTFSTLGISETIRAEDLNLTAWLTLASTLCSLSPNQRREKRQKNKVS